MQRNRVNPPINYENARLFGAICPARGIGAALASSNANIEATPLHLNEISRQVAKGIHVDLIIDRARYGIGRTLSTYAKASCRYSCSPAR